MLRLNLGDLIEWEGAEYTVAATDGMATLLVRLADGRRIWVDLPSLAAAGSVSLRPIAVRTAGDGVGAGGPPLTGPEAERALWWQAHLTEVIHGVPNPDDASLTPRPGYEQASKTGRREVKARELQAAGVTVSTRTLRRKEAAYIRGGLRGLLDHREDNRRTPEVDVRVTDAVLAVLQDTTDRSTVSTTTLINKVRAHVATRCPGGQVPLPSGRTLRRLVEHYDLRGLARGKATTRRSAAAWAAAAVA